MGATNLITRASRNCRPLCDCYCPGSRGTQIWADAACPRCRGTGGDFTRATDTEPATLRPSAARPTVPAPVAEVCQGALATLAAVGAEASTRALDAERNALACNALAERLARVPVKDADPGIAEHWRWLASEARAAAQVLARAATAERGAADAAKRLRALVADAESALTLIAPASTVTPASELPVVPQVGAAPTVLPPAFSEGE